MPVMTHQVGVKALEALGLAVENCQSLTIEFMPQSIVIATAKYMPSVGQIGDVLDLVRTLKPAPQTDE